MTPKEKARSLWNNDNPDLVIYMLDESKEFFEECYGKYIDIALQEQAKQIFVDLEYGLGFMDDDDVKRLKNKWVEE